MVRVGYFVAAMAIAAAVESVSAAAGDPEDARAQDGSWLSPAAPGSRTRDEPRGPEWFWRSGQSKPSEQERRRIQLLFFSGVDLWRHAAFAHDGLQWAPAGVGSDGIIFKAIASSGTYRYRAGSLNNAEVTGLMYGAAVMPGLHFTRHGVSVSVFAGLDVQVHTLSPFDPGNDLQGRRVGVRTAIDLWMEPTPQSMVTASATLSTIGGAYAARLAAGWRLFDWFYLGPETVAYGGPEYRQLRLGAHITGLRTRVFNWRLEWQGAVGFAFDDDDNTGAYARIGILWRH